MSCLIAPVLVFVQSLLIVNLLSAFEATPDQAPMPLFLGFSGAAAHVGFKPVQFPHHVTALSLVPGRTAPANRSGGGSVEERSDQRGPSE